MSDGSILAILNSAIVQSVQPSGTATGNSGSAQTGTLSQLLPGTVIRGEVIGRDNSGNPIIRTPQGTDVTIRTDTFLKYGNQVVIRVDQTGAGAKILSIDGQSPQPSAPSVPYTPDSVVDEVTTNATQARSSTTSGQPALSSVLQSPKDNNPEGVLIKSVLLSKSPSAPVALGNLPTQVRVPAEVLQPGSQVFLRISNSQQQPITQNAPQPQVANTQQPQTNSAPLQRLLTQPNAAQNPALTTTTPANLNTSQPAQQTVLSPSPLTQATSSNLQPIQSSVINSGTPVSASPSAGTTTVTSTNSQSLPQTTQLPNQPAPTDQRSAQRPISPPTLGSPAAPLQSSAGSSSIPGTFMAFNANGDATFQTPLGILKMPQGVFGNMRLTPGSLLMFDVTGFRVSGIGDAATALSSSGYSSITGMTDTLSDIFTIIQSVNPQAATELASRMPQTGSHFTGSTLFFIAAMMGGDASKLLGQRSIAILEQQGRGDLVKKLGADFVTARSGLGETSQNQNWQMFFVPLMHEQEIHPVRMFVKRDKEKEEKGKKKNADTRFVIEVSLSALGDIQLDGFVKQKDKGIQFDLMLRTLQPLLPEDEQAIYEIYNNAAQITGFTGNLSIQTLRDFPVKPMEEMLRSKEGSITA